MPHQQGDIGQPFPERGQSQNIFSGKNNFFAVAAANDPRGDRSFERREMFDVVDK
ncbi:MAG: hypothetical protein PHH14_02315 [Candidatus Margulisbacteria bacterium]|nr:hypothetical protein [Candidatus Margulisiibacteriota bacterium]